MRKSSRYAAYLPFVLVAVIGLVYHAGMKPMAGDDIFFRLPEQTLPKSC